MEWLNPPANWNVEYSQEENYIRSISLLTVHVEPHVDFWRKSHNGCISDNGHFLYQNVTGDFEVYLSIEGRYADLYDHGGLMIRENEENWVKAGIEYVNGIANVSAVVTRDYSDWSVISLGNFEPAQAVHFKLVMKHKSFEIFYSLDGINYSMYRVGFLTNSENLKIGIMCAAPKSETGFDIAFKNFKIKQL